MSVKLPKRLPLPEPDMIAGANPELIAYLRALNEQIQSLNRMLLDALTANMQTGTLVWDDGVNYSITLTFAEGRVTSRAVAVSSGVPGASWT